MTYHNAIKYINSAPNIVPKDDSASERILTLCEALKNPQKRIKYIRLAGNNGKSVCAKMLISILNKAQISSACLSMPIYPDIRENILINGNPIGMDELVEYVTELKNAVASINERNAGTDLPPFRPTAHEILLCVALLAFSAHKSAICLIESDHQGEDPSRFLPAPFSAIICGTIPSASKQKQDVSRIRSYICRGVREIVSAHQDEDAYRILSDACSSVNCRLTLAAKSRIEIKRLALGGTVFDYKGKTYSLKMCGQFQTANAAVAIESAEMLRRAGYDISEEAISRGLSSTSTPCKLEVLSFSPTIIADSSHTSVSIEAVCDSLSEFKEATGSKIRLCLPDGELIGIYFDALKRRGYSIESICALAIPEIDESDRGEFNAPITLLKNVKKTACQALFDLPEDHMLLISGDHNFTSAVRYEILSYLGTTFQALIK